MINLIRRAHAGASVGWAAQSWASDSLAEPMDGFGELPLAMQIAEIVGQLIIEAMKNKANVLVPKGFPRQETFSRPPETFSFWTR